MTTLEETREIFRLADAVCFDVDSTLIQDESIDELAKYCGVGEQVADLWVQISIWFISKQILMQI